MVMDMCPSLSQRRAVSAVLFRVEGGRVCVHTQQVDLLTPGHVTSHVNADKPRVTRVMHSVTTAISQLAGLQRSSAPERADCGNESEGQEDSTTSGCSYYTATLHWKHIQLQVQVLHLKAHKY